MRKFDFVEQTQSTVAKVAASNPCKAEERENYSVSYAQVLS
jgi:hypothetical protein